mgnify:CR=1 FL=1
MKKAIFILLISLLITSCTSLQDDALSRLDAIERACILGSKEKLEEASLSYTETCTHASRNYFSTALEI